MKFSIFNTKTIFFLFLVSISAFFSSCKNTQSPVPVVAVDIHIDLADPFFNDLKNLNGYVYITGGVNGIIIYRSAVDEFKAFERTCPYDPDCGKLIVSQDLFSAVDSVCCKSEFSLLLDGAVSKGPSQYPMVQYMCVYYKDANILHIKN